MSSEIIPAILATSALDLETKLAQLPKEVKFVHLDVLEDDYWTEVDIGFEVHLMVKEPEKIIDRWMERGAKRLITHILGGSTSKWEGVEIGLGVELKVSIDEILLDIPKVDFIHLMSIAEIGEQGHPLDERIFDRIKQVRDKFPNMTISVDGGVNRDNYQALIDAGVGRLIIGSHFKEVWNLLTKK